MLRQLIHKGGQAVLTLFLAVVVVFLGVRALPGDAAVALAGQEGSLENADAVRALHGLDRPLPVQFVEYIGRLVQGDLGRSSSTGTPVVDSIARALPVTLELAALSVLVAALIGLALGVVAALRQGKPSEMVVNAAALLGLSVPNFWLGLMAVLLLSVVFPVLPASGYVPFAEDPVENLRRMILPAAVLGTSLAAVIMRQTRSAMLESLSADYIRTAKAKGLSWRTVVVRHGVRNSLIVVVTVIGLQLGAMISGAVVTEQVFVLPGLGKLTLDAIFTRDYPMIQGVVLVVAAGYVLINLATDVLYSVIDPRIRVKAGES
ncbi:ABC transporter permease [Cellulomonas dongxiuzhuiae]|uniref:ABC transporter permease n=1 Tax=Cellulomonas dongxiuzhuiae TaxID=2819979 RepID=A0ABX8GLP7_9CELL|nr:ABC transporter permease [Cellulomonas dongxiuzhuiae]MBO3089535.1 ABC transporter permease [Cellulomonas dongxiuzhuiae]MBO3095171.1 ABC transporter permease [Cellulomonas dongxiuzhuiae]QWC16174.1 ABC transporter permease [Cellulomonas dongxiuzhuiae]